MSVMDVGWAAARRGEESMERIGAQVLSVMVVCTMAGCRTATRTIQEPRADFQVGEGGNRGYIVGTPPAIREDRKETRQMVEAEIEVPTRHKAASRKGSVMVGEVSPPETGEAEETWQPEGGAAGGVAANYDTYVVKPGDTLSSIAAHLYGHASRWHRLYQANRDRLGGPNQVKVGMTLRVPREAGSANTYAERAQDEKPIKFVK
ncbi:MAG: LysM peptidoglycan-binding domain-containing protein [Candidatus Omnitrophica bacterium]|nr:LysM peptidoglycan-binding domain-containing protein [Candidatus Omnitrophota bacterium]